MLFWRDPSRCRATSRAPSYRKNSARFAPDGKREHSLSGGSVACVELLRHDIEECTQSAGFLTPPKKCCRNFEGGTFPICQDADQTIGSDVVLAHDIRQYPESNAADHQFSRNTNVVHRNSAGHVNDLVARGTAKCPYPPGALVFGDNAVEPAEIADFFWGALSL